MGADSSDLDLRREATVYFHVGLLADLVGKVGVTVPLFEQWGVGVTNVIRWAQNTRLGAQLVASHADVVDHARHAAEQYRQVGRVERLQSTAEVVAVELTAAFPQIRGVLGTGFPWYCTDSLGGSRPEGVPASIEVYTTTQAEFFERKLLPAGLAVEIGGDQERSEAELVDLGVTLGQSSFNAYEYERWGVQPPTPRGSRTLHEHFAENLLDRGDRDWPCHFCTTLHNSSKFPQRWERDFMKSCLQCNQTPFIPRAVGVLSSDIDVVVVVEDTVDAAAMAAEVAGWIDVHPTYFRHDTDWALQLGAPHGPLDVFVVRRCDFFDALAAMPEDPQWSSITVRASVTWLPVTTLDYEIGKYFLLCMEPLIDVEPTQPLFSELLEIRRSYAAAVSADEVFRFTNRTQRTCASLLAMSLYGASSVNDSRGGPLGDCSRR
ncbi:hypothetical protein [Allobranchiibius sp. GilTou73]|uniref:hypothetical protein n=1 Tax=Allobranchiibius sp. GilTou73 TaxID=2904523 RepID=UPI001F31FBC4|nr:hypothetical protein [Allobranchiibius sp. GilTou73]UIJ35620.1 hypothetical protein LVQ62_04340 [Allobranchiibius sp. GilTou73]